MTQFELVKDRNTKHQRTIRAKRKVIGEVRIEPAYSRPGSDFCVILNCDKGSEVWLESLPAALLYVEKRVGYTHPLLKRSRSRPHFYKVWRDVKLATEDEVHVNITEKWEGAVFVNEDPKTICQKDSEIFHTPEQYPRDIPRAIEEFSYMGTSFDLV